MPGAISGTAFSCDTGSVVTGTSAVQTVCLTLHILYHDVIDFSQ